MYYSKEETPRDPKESTMGKSQNESQSVVALSTPICGSVSLDQVYYEVFEKAASQKDESFQTSDSQGNCRTSEDVFTRE
jgi:hypothetical protein